jgi:hypothetical protein
MMKLVYMRMEIMKQQEVVCGCWKVVGKVIIKSEF